jgi:type IV pilus assembly protein PilW
MNTIRKGCRSQRGFTMLELLVATTISVFLLGGLFATLQGTRQAYTQQSQLAQLQDNQRLAMTIIAGVVESSGYFPSPQTYSASNFMTAPTGAFTTVGQSIVGTASAAAPGDTITVRYGADVADNVYNCRGGVNTGGAPITMVNTFKVAVDAAGVSWLVCNDGVQDYQLVSGITDMQLSYGVHLGPTTGSCTDTYQTSAQMVATPANWNVVCSVIVTLTFNNPASLGAANATVPVTRVIALMNTAGS